MAAFVGMNMVGTFGYPWNASARACVAAKLAAPDWKVESQLCRTLIDLGATGIARPRISLSWFGDFADVGASHSCE